MIIFIFARTDLCGGGAQQLATMQIDEITMIAIARMCVCFSLLFFQFTLQARIKLSNSIQADKACECMQCLQFIAIVASVYPKKKLYNSIA